MIRRRRTAAKRRSGSIQAVVRADHRTSNLVHRLSSGEIALLDHADLDQASAQRLIERGVSAVLNAADSITGSVPNAGPLVLHRAGVLLIDRLGADAFTLLRDGERIEVHPDGSVARGGVDIVAGRVVAGDVLDEALRRANRNLGPALESFVRATVGFVERERALILHGEGMPRLRTPIAGRHVVVIGAGTGIDADLERLRRYLREQRPVVIAVDAIAESLGDHGVRPDVIVGDMEAISSQALTAGAEIVVQARPDGRAPGFERVRALGIDPGLIASQATSEDVALLLAYEHDAALIVSVGGRDDLVEYLDEGRAGSSSTFVTRLKVAQRLVDAETVASLTRAGVRTRDVLVLAGSAIVALAAALAVAPGPRLVVREIADWFGRLF